VLTALRQSRLGGRGTEVLLVAFVILAGTVAGLASVRNAKLGAVAVSALVVIMLSARKPVVLAIVACGGVFAVQRVGAASITPGSVGGISYSDALLASALVLAVPALLGAAELPRLRLALQGTAVYLALLLPTVIANPSSRAYLEWTHRLVMVGGALLVGAWIAREKRIAAALRLVTLIACVVSLVSIEEWFRNGFGLTNPLNLNKNFVGAILGVVIVVLVIGADYLDIDVRLRITAIALVAAALLIARSRGGDLAAVCGLLVAFVLDPRAHSARVKLGAVTVALVLGVFAGWSINNQLNLDKTDLRNSSVGVRYNVEKVTRQIWRTQPVEGVGLKYFNSGKYGPYAVAANNVVDNELAESGLLGLGGFVILQTMAVASGLRRRVEPLIAIGIGAVLGQLLHGMVDIYWNAGVVALPFLLLGMGLAREPVEREARPWRWRELARWRSGDEGQREGEGQGQREGQDEPEQPQAAVTA
jgi:hypothetical protein